MEPIAPEEQAPPPRQRPGDLVFIDTGFGMPGGYEFATLLETIKMVSTGDSGLSEETKTRIKSLAGNVHIQVFVTLM
mgnify:CR=1 FL=1